MEAVVAVINRALRARGWSAQKASIESGGSPELIRNLRRGREPRLAQLQALCDVLSLEFYIGPPRRVGAVDELRLEEALEATQRTLQAHAVRPTPRDWARAVAALYELLDRTREPATAQRVERLMAALTSKERGEGSEPE